MAHALKVVASMENAALAGIDIVNISKTFFVDGRSVEVLRNINLEIGPGDFVSIVGPSGCGKSTLLRMIAGLENADEGDIFVGGRRVEGPGLDRGMVFQDHRLFPWLTVEKNILLGLRTAPISDQQKRQVVADLVRLVGLDGFSAAQPHQLSGGMSQRAAIARALAPRPGILLLDEPFGALDSLTRAHLQGELLRIHRQQHVTTVMVTHDVEEAVYLSDCIVVLEPRPGRMRKCIAIPSGQSRRRNDPAFMALKGEILEMLGVSEPVV